MGSSIEHGIFEQMYGKTGTSAVKVLSVANSERIPFYSVDATNIDDVLPGLEVSEDVKVDIQNAINSGKKVIVPETEVVVDRWRGTS